MVHLSWNGSVIEHIHPGRDQVHVLFCPCITGLLNDATGESEKVILDGNQRIPQIIPSKGECGKISFIVGRKDGTLNGVSRVVSGREVYLHRDVSAEVLHGGIERLGVAEFGVIRIGLQCRRAPHLLKLQGKSTRQRLLLENDQVVQVIGEGGRGEVGGPGEYEGFVLQIAVNHHKFVVHA